MEYTTQKCMMANFVLMILLFFQTDKKYFLVHLHSVRILNAWTNQAAWWFQDVHWQVWPFRSWGERIRENIKLTSLSHNKIIQYWIWLRWQSQAVTTAMDIMVVSLTISFSIFCIKDHSFYQDTPWEECPWEFQCLITSMTWLTLTPSTARDSTLWVPTLHRPGVNVSACDPSILTKFVNFPISDVGPVHKAPPAVATQLVVPTQLSDGPVSDILVQLLRTRQGIERLRQIWLFG